MYVFDPSRGEAVVDGFNRNFVFEVIPYPGDGYSVLIPVMSEYILFGNFPIRDHYIIDYTQFYLNRFNIIADVTLVMAPLNLKMSLVRIGKGKGLGEYENVEKLGKFSLTEVGHNYRLVVGDSGRREFDVKMMGHSIRLDEESLWVMLRIYPVRQRTFTEYFTGDSRIVIQYGIRVKE
jgi:hypothetical protein